MSEVSQEVAHAEQAFSFLTEVPNAKFELIRDSWKPVLFYGLGDYFVEVELDIREQAVFVLVGTTENGALPGGYYVDGSRRVRRHLGAVLMKYGDDDDRALGEHDRDAARNSRNQSMSEQIDRSAALVREVYARLPRLLRLAK